MTETRRLTLQDAEALCVRALVNSDTSEANAVSTARALVHAEADGQRGHGLSRLPIYAAQARSGKVDGQAVPALVRPATALVQIDAKSGFAYPAIDLAADALPEIASTTGVAAAMVRNSHHLGQAGAHAERFAAAGLVALVMSNSPRAIPFWGGRKPMMGTNPIAFAAPREDGEPLVIDLALSKVARGKIVAAQRAGETIPDDWALDADGDPTSNPSDALAGSMLPIGDAKGAALVLMVELLTAALTGSQFGYEASSFFDADGEPPHIGQTIIVFESATASGGVFAERLENILGEIEQTDGARVPGTRRLAARSRARRGGLDVPADLVAEIEALTAPAAANG